MLRRLFLVSILILNPLVSNEKADATTQQDIEGSLRKYAQSVDIYDLQHIVEQVASPDRERLKGLSTDDLSAATKALMSKLPAHICANEVLCSFPWEYTYELAIRYLYALQPELDIDQKQKVANLSTLVHMSSKENYELISRLEFVEERYSIQGSRLTSAELLKQMEFMDYLAMPYCMAMRSVTEVWKDKRTRLFAIGAGTAYTVWTYLL